MIRHLLKLVWNRKRTQALIMLEIFFSFVVVFALVATGIHLLSLYRVPLGFDYEDVWAIAVDRETQTYPWTPEEARTFGRLMREIEAMSPVVAVAGGTTAPYRGSVSRYGWQFDGRDILAEGAFVTVGFAEVLGINLVAGRWFTEADSALDWEPTVIDRELATLLFGNEDPIGKTINEPSEDGTESRVIGLVEEFRRGGEFDDPYPFMFQPAREDTDEATTMGSLLVRVAPGTKADFEEPLLRRLQAVAKGWTFAVRPLEAGRESMLQTRLVPLAVAGVVGCFLLLMVVLGLTGVMWQNVTRRTREIGIRRAAGACRSSIHRQIVAEVMLTAAVGVLLGGVLAIQVPLIGVFSHLSLGVVLTAMAVSGAFMLLLAALCGLYPGWSATRINPAEALHYE